MNRALLAVSALILAVPALRAGDEPAPPRWTRSKTAALHPHASFAPPDALIERVLVDRERRGGSLEDTPSLRLWLSRFEVGVGCGTEQRADGSWVATGCTGPQLEGVLDLAAGGQTIEWKLVAPVTSRTEAGYDWSGLERLRLDGKLVYDVRVSGSVAIGQGNAPSHQLTIAWEGPIPTTSSDVAPVTTATVPASTWEVHATKEGHGAVYDVRLPPCLLERILIAHELRGRSEQASNVRKWASDWSVILGTNLLETSEKGKRVVKRTGATKALTSGMVRVGDVEFAVAESEALEVANGYDYRVVVAVTIEKARYEAELRAKVTTTMDARKLESRLEGEWRGPFARETR
jgi:hypothetical protein